MLLRLRVLETLAAMSQAWSAVANTTLSLTHAPGEGQRILHEGVPEWGIGEVGAYDKSEVGGALGALGARSTGHVSQKAVQGFFEDGVGKPGAQGAVFVGS